MGKRAVSAVAVAALALAMLSGCEAKPGAFVRSSAQADVAAWTQDARSAIGSPVATVKFDGFQTCRTDTGYFATRFQWHTVTNLAVPASRQTAEVAAISRSFAAMGWRPKSAAGIVTITGPAAAARRGIVLVQTAGATQLAVAVTSPCYG
jgi:hypothetical protein